MVADVAVSARRLSDFYYCFRDGFYDRWFYFYDWVDVELAFFFYRYDLMGR